MNYDAEFGVDENGKQSIQINYSYPKSDEYDFVSYMERIDFDQEKEDDIRKGNGFIISSPKATIKKDVKNPDGIFSTRFGQRLGDVNPFIEIGRASCRERV